ncbi:hypothetical protein [Glycomyces buryatensis]|uniref:ATP synthase protein I n=1 Tax=Glycomyces buryatensis TaxID=2570927 RepID=A0A4S8QN67_9ACTN|nr:hypothetical protein [Glycomyces buryatensis]THV42889.1 hypothetical protein FAB82_03835 [Glycomyces buryatensis]
MRASRGFLKPCFIASGLALLVAVGLGWAFGGAVGAAGAGGGVALAALGFAGSVWAIAAAENIDVRLTLPVALLTYMIKLVLFGTALWAIDQFTPDALRPSAFGIIGGALTWLTVQVVWTFRAKIPYIELEKRP